MNRVLFVDDEPQILNALKRGLLDEPYESLFATSGEMALKLLAENEIAVLVTDMRMPGMNGLELLKRVREPYPDLVKIVLSGYTQLPQVLATVNQGDIFKFITKPWDLDGDFRQVILEAVDYHVYRAAVRKAQQTLERKNASFQNILKTYDDKLLSLREELVLARELTRKWCGVVGGGLLAAEADGDRRGEVFTRYSRLLTEALDTLPSQSRRFSMNQLAEELKRRIGKTLPGLEILLPEAAGFSAKGRFELLAYLLGSLSELLVKPDGAGAVLALQGQPEAGRSLAGATLEIPLPLLRLGPETVQMVSWLREWLVQCGGTLTLQESGDGRAVTVLPPFEE